MSAVDLEYQPMITPEEIRLKIKDHARVLEEDYDGKDLVIVMIMKGAICFVSDLIRELEMNCALDFIYCSSYEGDQRGELKVFGLDQIDVTGRDVLVLDDIYDSGTTIQEVKRQLELKHPASIKSIVLLRRKMPEHKAPAENPDYTLFDIENDAFVIGYGLDYNEYYRGLPGIYGVTKVKEEEKQRDTY